MQDGNDKMPISSTMIRQRNHTYLNKNMQSKKILKILNMLNNKGDRVDKSSDHAISP